MNDFRLVRPVYRNGVVFCWIASAGHWLDIGGNVPGGFNSRATESFQEGVRFPPIKLFRAGVINEDIIDILAANSRVPTSNFGDLNGQLNALALGERRSEPAYDYGERHSAALDLHARRRDAGKPPRAPDGTYSFEDFL